MLYSQTHPCSRCQTHSDSTRDGSEPRPLLTLVHGILTVALDHVSCRMGQPGGPTSDCASAAAHRCRWQRTQRSLSCRNGAHAGAQAARGLGKTLRSFAPTIQELTSVSRDLKNTLDEELGIDEIRREFASARVRACTLSEFPCASS